MISSRCTIHQRQRLLSRVVGRSGGVISTTPHVVIRKSVLYPVSLVQSGWMSVSTVASTNEMSSSSHYGFSRRRWATLTAACLAATLTMAPLHGNNDQNEQNDSTANSERTVSILPIYSLLEGLLSPMSVNITNCSGIVGVVGSQGTSSRDFLLQGLRILEHRGFDGVGLATIDKKGNIAISKSVVTGNGYKNYSTDGDQVLHLLARHFGSSSSSASRRNTKDKNTSEPATGMAHTRWATFGDKANEYNVHPHLDSTGRIALVHNGTLTNARMLRAELQEAGHVFDGESDSEVIAKLIGHYFYGGVAESAKASETAVDNNTKGMGFRGKTMSIKDATRKALERCDGTWGLCILCADTPDELIVACQGSSLYIGLGDDKIYVASETSAFNKYTKNFIRMRDGEIGALDADGRTLDLSRIEEKSPPSGQNDQDEEELVLPEGYDHWTMKEIHDQPETVARAMGFGSRLTLDRIRLGGLDKHVDRLKDLEHVSIAGCGSSLNAAKYGERLMKHLGSVKGRIAALDTAEVDGQHLAQSRNKDYTTGLIAVTQSGQSLETMNIVDNANYEGVVSIGVVNVVGSPVARETTMGVYCNAGPENGVTSTKTFTSQVTCLALIALWFREMQDELTNGQNGPPNQEVAVLKEALLRLPISLGMSLKTRDQCKEIAKRLKGKEHCFILGKGFGESIAYEGALKIKEMSYLHAEGYSGGALKHGPFALIDSDESGKFGATPIILLILDDQHSHLMRTAAEEVKARGADLIIITDKPELARDLDDNPIIVPTNGPLTALGALVPLQLIAYELAVVWYVPTKGRRNSYFRIYTRHSPSLFSFLQ